MSGGFSSSLGNDSLLAALALLADPVELKRRKDEFLETERHVLEMTANIGPIQEVAKLRADAESTVKAANERMSNAEREAAEVGARVQAEMAELMERTQAEVDAMSAAATVDRAQAAQLLSDAKAKLADVVAKGEEIIVETAAIARARGEIDRQREELANTARLLEEKRQRIAAASEHLAGAIES